MINKENVNEVLRGVITDDFIKLWWDLKLPGLGMATPNEVWEKDPARVLEYARGYLETSFI